MDYSTFIKLMRLAQTAQDGYLLLERAEKEGTPELREWLWMYGEKWAINENSYMRSVMFLAQYPDCGSQDLARDLSLVEFNNYLLLDRAEARGLDVSKWSGAQCVAAMLYPSAIKWLNQRTDVRSKIMPVSLRSPFWEVPLRNPEDTLESLAIINYPELMGSVAKRIEYFSVSYITHTLMDFIRREHCLANHGALLRVLMRKKIATRHAENAGKTFEAYAE